MNELQENDMFWKKTTATASPTFHIDGENTQRDVSCISGRWEPRTTSTGSEGGREGERRQRANPPWGGQDGTSDNNHARQRANPISSPAQRWGKWRLAQTNLSISCAYPDAELAPIPTHNFACKLDCCSSSHLVHPKDDGILSHYVVILAQKKITVFGHFTPTFSLSSRLNQILLLSK